MSEAFQWLAIPALLVTNCLALYGLYSYKAAYDALHADHCAYLRAKEQRLAHLAQEKRDKDDKKARSAAARQQPPTTKRPSPSAPHRSPPSQAPPPALLAASRTARSDDEEKRLVPDTSSAFAAVKPPFTASSDPLHPFHAKTTPSRVVHHEDALVYLRRLSVLPGCVVTSLPDASETPLTVPAWRRWFVEAVAEILTRLPPDGLAMFYQTDTRMSGTWVDKSHLLNLGGDRAGARLVWHKVVVQSAVDTVKGTKAAYAHLLCFSPLPLRATGEGGVQSFTERSEALSPDLLMSRGAMTWKRAMGLLACDFCCAFIQQFTAHRTVVDPFCGWGSVLAVANARGMNAVGVELSRRRCCLARQLDVRGQAWGKVEEVGAEEELVGERGMKARRRAKRLRKELEREEKEKQQQQQQQGGPSPAESTADEQLPDLELKSG